MKLLKILAGALFATVTASSSAAVVIVTDNSVTDNIPGVTGFATNGAMMDGLLVTANFSGGTSQTLAWADTGATSGGVSGAGWGLSLNGDSYFGFWQFTINPDLGQLLNFTLDASGSQQVTLFDTFFGGAWGTDGTAEGTDFSCNIDCNATVTYSNAVAVMPGAAVGDLFHTMHVNFSNDLGNFGPRTDFAFNQDTDNDIRLNTGFVPEPGSIPLLGLGLLAMAGFARRRRN